MLVVIMHFPPELALLGAVTTTVPTNDWWYVYADALSSSISYSPLDLDQPMEAAADAFSDMHDDTDEFGGVSEQKTGDPGTSCSRLPSDYFVLGLVHGSNWSPAVACVGLAVTGDIPKQTPLPSVLEGDSDAVLQRAGDPRRWLSVAVGLSQLPDPATVVREFGVLIRAEVRAVASIISPPGGVILSRRGVIKAADVYTCVLVLIRPPAPVVVFALRAGDFLASMCISNRRLPCGCCVGVFAWQQ